MASEDGSSVDGRSSDGDRVSREMEVASGNSAADDRKLEEVMGDGCGFMSLFKSKQRHKDSEEETLAEDTPPADEPTEGSAAATDSQPRRDTEVKELPQGCCLSAMPSDTTYTYNMKHPKRGKMIIISNKNFQEASGMKDYPRNGTEFDAENLKTVFTHLGFDCELHEDVTRSDMLNIFLTASRRPVCDVDCMAFALLSHGDTKDNKGIIYGTDGEIYIDKLLEPVKCQHTMANFAGKPKLLFIQACRGTGLDEGVEVTDAAVVGLRNTKRIPIEADFLYMYSTAPGYFSFRATRGSVFIRTLCEMLWKYHGTKDLLTILTRVNYQVAYFFESHVNKKNPDHEVLSHKKQIPSIVSTLTKDVYFATKENPNKTHSEEGCV